MATTKRKSKKPAAKNVPKKTVAKNIPMIAMSRRNIEGRDAMQWANSKYGNPLICEIAQILFAYGFTEGEMSGLLPLLAHPLHLYVKWPQQ